MIKRLLYSAMGAFVIALSCGCSLLGINTVEEAAYSVVVEDDRFELRHYKPMIIAETHVKKDFNSAGDVAFKRLFQYISGGNDANREISMTAPVIAAPSDNGGRLKHAGAVPASGKNGDESWRYMFVLPAGYTLGTAPEPADNNIRLVEVPGKRIAVVRYSGTWNEKTMQRKTAELEDWIVANELTSISGPRWAGYNPPWTIPLLRRNEVMIDVR